MMHPDKTIVSTAGLSESRRLEIIDALIEDDVNSFTADPVYAADTMRDGFKGYINFTDDELLSEHGYRFDASAVE